MNNSPEINYLIEEVAKKYGGRLETSTDFDTLEASIGEVLGDTVSSATLKRIWGYVAQHPLPRISTLDLLARYTGRKDYRTLCMELQETSGFFSAEALQSDCLDPGKHLKIKWMPDREVILRHLGDGNFAVEDAGTSKLRTGDQVRTAGFIQGQPLYLSVTRDGRQLPPYVAGRAKGITAIEVY